jgi:ribosome recycling factor
LVKQSKAECEDAKISVRNARRDAIEHFKKMQKEGLPEDVVKDTEERVQKIHDKFIKKIDDMFAAKEKEIMTI